MAQLAIDIDKNGLEHPLQGEEAYFNGYYSQCVSYKTLALFLYHPAMQCILRLDIMEIKMSPHMKYVFFF